MGIELKKQRDGKEGNAIINKHTKPKCKKNIGIN